MWIRFAVVGVVLTLLGAAPPLRPTLTDEQRKELGAKLAELDAAGNKLFKAGKIAEMTATLKAQVEVARRLHGTDDHPDLAQSLNNLGFVLTIQGRLSEAEPFFREALAMHRRLFTDDHAHLANSLNNVGNLLHNQGRLAEAEPFYRDSLAMHQRLIKGDHGQVAIGLNNLGMLLLAQGKATEAERFLQDSLAMRRRLFKGDHQEVAMALHNLAGVLSALGKHAEGDRLFRESLAIRRRVFKGDNAEIATSLAHLGLLRMAEAKLNEAEPFFRDALAMRQRLFKNDHPELAYSLSYLGRLLQEQGRLTDAEPHLRDALAMRRRLYPGDHLAVAGSLSNFGGLLTAQGRFAAGEPFLHDAVAMRRRIADSFAVLKSEGEALTLAASLPLVRDGLLSNHRLGGTDPAATYAEVWASKAALARVFERRHLAARAATDPKSAELLTELAAARRRRSELLLARQFRDPATRKQRDDDLHALTNRVADLDRAVRPLLPAIDLADHLAKATPEELQKLLPADTAVVDFLAYAYFEPSKGKPGDRQTSSYLAFVLTRDKVTRVELGSAKSVDYAVRLWREAITVSRDVPTDLPAKVRDLVWAKVRKELPASAKTVYLSPDLALTALPWAALPGDKPGSILLEDFAVAVVPHAPFLLDKLRPAPAARQVNRLLAVGGVNYAEPPAKTDDHWRQLDATAAEAKGVAGLADGRKLEARRLAGADASAERVLAELPAARFAHLATHGFFADKKFRSALQIDEKLFEMRGGERVGTGALSPMVLSGLVFAGANKPDTPGRGLLTGEALIDRDLSGLELAVLSACETGLGDVAGGEGVFGLQRAFHVAGTRNVVASLWKVDDAATAALMAVFYKKLWQDNLTPIESLRQAQLEVYRNPTKLTELAGALRALKVVKGSGKTEEIARPITDGKAHPRLWAAFTPSGPGTLPHAADKP